MEILHQLTPAEVLLLLSPVKSSGRDLARATFLDLVVRGILAISIGPSSLDVGQGTRKSRKVVTIGPNFRGYRPMKHEAVFLQAFMKDQELRISLFELIKVAFERIPSSDEYKLKYIFSDRISKYFRANIIQRIIGTKQLNDEGLQLGKEITEHLRTIQGQLDKRRKGSTRMEGILLAMRGNILLLPETGRKAFEFLNGSRREKRADRQWPDQGWMYAHSSVHGTTTQPNVLGATAVTFHAALSHLDQAGSIGADSTATATDSGCSGCTGCGGCGGCS